MSCWRRGRRRAWTSRSLFAHQFQRGVVALSSGKAYAHNCKLGCVLEAAGRTWEGIIDSKGELSRSPGVRRHRGGFGTFDGLEPSQRVDFVYFTKYTVARKHNTVPCRYWDDSGSYGLLKGQAPQVHAGRHVWLSAG